MGHDVRMLMVRAMTCVRTQHYPLLLGDYQVKVSLCSALINHVCFPNLLQTFFPGFGPTSNFTEIPRVGPDHHAADRRSKTTVLGDQLAGGIPLVFPQK